MQSTINSSRHETFSLCMRRRYDRLPTIPDLSAVGDSHVPQKLSIDLSPLIFDPCQICFRGLLFFLENEKKMKKMSAKIHENLRQLR